MESVINIEKIQLEENDNGTATVSIEVSGNLVKNYIPIEATISHPRLEGGKANVRFDVNMKKLKMSKSLTNKLSATIPLQKGEEGEFIVETFNSNNLKKVKEKAIRRLRHTSRSKGLKAYLG